MYDLNHPVSCNANKGKDLCNTRLEMYLDLPSALEPMLSYFPEEQQNEMRRFSTMAKLI